MKDNICTLLPPGKPWGELIHHFDTVESTNTLAKTMAAQGAPSGTVIIADHQTVGRGRLGRSFHSPAGSGIYMSVILRPNCPPDRLMHLTCAAAVAMCDELAKATTPAIRKQMTEAYVNATRMEWMFWDSAWKKEGWPK